MNLKELRKYAGDDVAQDAVNDISKAISYDDIESRDEIIESLRAQIVAQARELADAEKVRDALTDFEREISGRFGSDADMTPDTKRVVMRAREALDRPDCGICRTLERQGNPSRCCARWNPLMVSRGGVSDAGGPGWKSSHEAHRVTVCANCGQFRVSGHIDDQWFSVTFELRSEETLKAAGMPLQKDDGDTRGLVWADHPDA
jgi:hypothetical protein